MSVSSLDDLKEDYLEKFCQWLDTQGEFGEQDGVDEAEKATKLSRYLTASSIWLVSATAASAP